MAHAWSMYLGLSGVRWPLAKTHLHVIMGNLHFKKSRSQVTAVDPKLFFQILGIYSGNIIFEGYWNNSSSYEDIDPWSSRTKIQVQKWKFFNQKKKKIVWKKLVQVNWILPAAWVTWRDMTLHEMRAIAPGDILVVGDMTAKKWGVFFDRSR